MIIKSHIRGGYRAAADYMKDIGKNEKTRLAELSDTEAQSLDEAFHRMWKVASNSKCKKPLHHISINPMKDERLTDKQVLAIVERCEDAYGYKMFHHQRVIVEHVKDGRQHFHVIWNRVSLMSGRAVWPGHHWIKSKQICREMEKELGLKSPIPKRYRRTTSSGKKPRVSHHRQKQSHSFQSNPFKFLLIPIKTRYTAPKQTKSDNASNNIPFHPLERRKGWPEAAVYDWEIWGHRNPRRFFTLWPELAPN